MLQFVGNFQNSHNLIYNVLLYRVKYYCKNTVAVRLKEYFTRQTILIKSMPSTVKNWKRKTIVELYNTLLFSWKKSEFLSFMLKTRKKLMDYYSALRTVNYVNSIYREIEYSKTYCVTNPVVCKQNLNRD